MYTEFWIKAEEITKRLCHRWLGRINARTEFERKLIEAVVWIVRLHEDSNGFKFKKRQSFLTKYKTSSFSKNYFHGARFKENTVLCFLLGNSQASEFYMPTFRNTLSV